MNKFKLKKQLKKESETHTPDILDRIKICANEHGYLKDSGASSVSGAVENGKSKTKRTKNGSRVSLVRSRQYCFVLQSFCPLLFANLRILRLFSRLRTFTEWGRFYSKIIGRKYVRKSDKRIFVRSRFC